MTDNNTTPSCSDRIAAHAASRAETFSALSALAGAYDYPTLLEALESEEARAILSELAPSDIPAELLEQLTQDPETLADDIDLEDALIDAGADVDGIRDDAQTRIYEMPLCVTRLQVFRVDLSTGGPADWLEVRVSGEEDDYSIDGITYVFQDWFDGARQELSGSELEAAESFARALIPELS